MTSGVEDVGDHQRDPSKCDVCSRTQQALSRFGGARVMQAKDDQQTEGDADHEGTDQVTEHQHFGIRKQEHHRGGGEQGRIERGRQREEHHLCHQAGKSVDASSLTAWPNRTAA